MLFPLIKWDVILPNHFFPKSVNNIGKILREQCEVEKKNDTNTINICRNIHTQLFSRSVVFNSAAPWAAAYQASLSFIISQSSLKHTQRHTYI